MFKNASHDPLAIPTPVKRVSVGPTRRIADWRTNPLIPRGHFFDEDQGRFVPEKGWNPDDEPIVDPRPSPLFDATERHYDPERAQFKDDLRAVDQHGWNPDTDVTDPRQGWQDDWKVSSKIPSKVARVLTEQAREFLAQDHGCDDRSELLYRARRHAATLTSTWSREASQRAAEAFCARVAELIPNRSKTAAVARSATHVADFDDQLLF